MLYEGKLPEIDFSQVRVLAFDKDETLTPANKIMEHSMANRLKEVVRDRYIVILTARDIDICREHILPLMNEEQIRKNRVIFACCNGSQIYEYSQDSSEYILKSELEGKMPDEDFFKKMVQKFNTALGVESVTFERRSDTM